MSPIPASGFSPSTSRATSRMRSRVSVNERTREDSVGTTPSLHNGVQRSRLHTSVQRRVALCFEAQEKPMTAPTPPTSTLVRPFTVSISESEIDDVKQRLARTRWPDPETVGDWSQGVRVENARSLVDYWERGYDWRRFESGLNRFPQFLTGIDGLDIHFIHVRSKNPNAMPLILTHGWPGSILEFGKLIDPLTDPVSFGGDAADSFDVVVPRSEQHTSELQSLAYLVCRLLLEK